MPDVVLAYKVSKKAMRLVKAGKAVISSGGVRLKTGELVELAKPVAKLTGSNIPMGPLTFISSLGNNVQSVFIQKGVNKANRSLQDLKKQGVEIIKDLDLIHADTLEIKQGMASMMDELHNVNQSVTLLNEKADINLLQMNQLNNMVHSLQAVTWLNCAFGILNIGISIAGFTKVLNSLSGISEQISALDQKIGWNLMNDYRQQFDSYYNQIRTDIQTLQNPELRPSRMHQIPEHLNNMQPFLERVRIDFQAGNVDDELACNIIFGLTNPFAQEVQFYSVRYLYEKGELPAAYDSWIKVIADIGEKNFQSKLDTALSLEHMELTLKQQKDILDASVLSSRLQLDNMMFSNLLTDKIPEMEYLDFDRYLIGRSSSEENFVETEDGALLTIA